MRRREAVDGSRWEWACQRRSVTLIALHFPRHYPGLLPIHQPLNSYIHDARHPMAGICITRAHTYAEDFFSVGVRYWRRETEEQEEERTQRRYAEGDTLSEISVCERRRGGRYLQSARSPEKWSRRWRKWVGEKVIGCNKGEARGKKKRKKREKEKGKRY